ncbi:MAK10-like protein [Tanacetum coccineum]
MRYLFDPTPSDSLDLDDANRERMRLCLFQFSLRDQASNWLERLPAGSISTWEDVTTHFLAQFFPPGRTTKFRNDILMFQQHQGESLSESWTRFKDLLQKVPHHGIDLWLQNDPRDFGKPVKAISLPQDVSITSDCHLIELENQDQHLMEAHIAPMQPIQVNKITSSCEICSGPHDTQYYMENPEQAFVEYASSRTDEAGVVSNDCKDTWRWVLGKDGDFKVKELSILIEEKIIQVENGRLSVRVELYRRGINLDSVLCPSCTNIMESCAHSLVTCDLAMSVWEKVFSWWKVGIDNAFSIDEFFLSYRNVNIPVGIFSLWQAVIWTIGYFIWKERNDPLELCSSTPGLQVMCLCISTCKFAFSAYKSPKLCFCAVLLARVILFYCSAVFFWMDWNSVVALSHVAVMF